MELVLLCIAATCFSQHIDFLSPLRRAAQDGLRGSAAHMPAASARGDRKAICSHTTEEVSMVL